MQTDLRYYLKNELERRLKANPRYSLRAFARALQISPTLLSLVISGRREPSRRLVEKVASSLDLAPYERKKLHQNTMQAKIPWELKEASIHDQFSEMSIDAFTVIAEWYHFAILNLMRIKGAKFDARWISRRLGIREMEARLAMDRLIKLKYMGKVDGKWQRLSPNLKVDNKTTTAATRQYHNEQLKLAMASLQNDPYEIREHCGMVMAIHPDVIPKAKEMLRTFRREFAVALEAEHEPSEVYHLNIQLYPLSRGGK